jgi:hypothetical protein
MTKDDLCKLGAKTAKVRLKQALAEAMPGVKWDVFERHKVDTYPEPRIIAVVHLTAMNTQHIDPRKAPEILATLVEAFPGFPWSVRAHYAEWFKPGVEPKTEGSLDIYCGEVLVSDCEAPPGKRTELNKAIKEKREREESMAKWRRQEAQEVDPDLQREALELGLKELAKRHHPDAGGSHDKMVRINKLREQIKP